jgi:hypothetical protein
MRTSFQAPTATEAGFLPQDLSVFAFDEENAVCFPSDPGPVIELCPTPHCIPGHDFPQTFGLDTAKGKDR